LARPVTRCRRKAPNPGGRPARGCARIPLTFPPTVPDFVRPISPLLPVFSTSICVCFVKATGSTIFYRRLTAKYAVVVLSSGDCAFQDPFRLYQLCCRPESIFTQNLSWFCDRAGTPRTMLPLYSSGMHAPGSIEDNMLLPVERSAL
jgi:hypothetical protein